MTEQVELFTGENEGMSENEHAYTIDVNAEIEELTRKWCTLNQAAEVIGVTVSRATQMIAEGKLTSFRLGTMNFVLRAQCVELRRLRDERDRARVAMREPRPAPAKLAGVLTVPEVAAYLQISESAVYKLARTGELKAIRFGASVRVRREDLNEMLERKRGR